MRGRPTVRARLGLAGIAIAVGLISAGCFPPAPPGPAGLTISPSPVNFGTSSQAAGFPMPARTITITNTGGHTATNILVNPVSIYSVPGPSCTSLAPGQSCTATVLFCPNAQVPYDFPLSVTFNDATSGAALSAGTMLIGTGTS
jgi:hypothetical protein